MEIRQAQGSDADLLARIVRDANRPVAAQFGLTCDNAPAHPSFCTGEWILAGMDRGETYFLILDGAEAAGCVAYESPAPDLAYLNRLAVLPKAQGQGLGAVLVARVEEQARAEGKQKISIGIIKAHTRLRRWYEGLGFTEAGTKAFDHLPFDVLFMQRDLG